MRRILTVAMLGLAATAGGCNYLAFVLSAIVPEPPTPTIDAEYSGLPDHSVAIVVFASQATQYDHPLAQLEVASVVAGELQREVKNVTVIDPRRVVKYQNENLNWETMDKTALGRQFSADYVLYVALSEFATVEPGSMNLYRGRITAEASLFKTSLGEKDARVWGSQDFRILYPPQAAVGLPGETDESIRYATERAFAQAMVNKFHKYKVPKEGP